MYFYSHEGTEPPHVHVDRDHDSAKFWLESVELARNLGFGAVELAKIERLIANHQAELLRAWHDYFGQ